MRSGVVAVGVLEAVRDLERCAAGLGEVEVHGASAQVLTAVVEALERVDAQVLALKGRAVAQVEADGSWSVGGARSLQGWVRHHTGRFASEAGGLVRLARGLRDHLPATARALAAGEIGVDHAKVLVRHALGSPACLERLQDAETGEAFLVEQARRLDATGLNRVVRAWAMYADPEAADAAWRDDAGRESFSFARTMDGWAGQIWLSETSGAVVHEALTAMESGTSAGDVRTPGQRRAAVLVELAGFLLDSGTAEPGARIRPHVAVTADLATVHAVIEAQRSRHTTDRGAQAPGATGRPDDGSLHPGGGEDVLPQPGGGEGAFPPSGGEWVLPSPGVPWPLPDGGGERGAGTEVLSRIDVGLDYDVLAGVEPARLGDGTPIPFGLFAQLLCEAGLYRVIFGADSEVLDVGREKRLFTAGQTRAILTRDQACRFPSCTAPPRVGEIHHAVYFATQGGKTDIGNGVLLCRYHHSLVHRLELSIERRRDGWYFLRPDGRLYGRTPSATPTGVG